jgi:hypothetical protein
MVINRVINRSVDKVGVPKGYERGHPHPCVETRGSVHSEWVVVHRVIHRTSVRTNRCSVFHNDEANRCSGEQVFVSRGSEAPNFSIISIIGGGRPTLILMSATLR